MYILFINAKEKKIEKIILNKKPELEKIYELLECKLIDRFYVACKNQTRTYNDCCYIDDEGGFKKGNHIFTYNGNIVYGNALVVGTDSKDGSDIEPEISQEELKKYISFPKFIHQEWLDRFLFEKEISIDTKLQGEGGYTIRSLVDHISLSEKASDDLKKIIVQLDCVNGDILQFLNQIPQDVEIA